MEDEEEGGVWSLLVVMGREQKEDFNICRATETPVNFLALESKNKNKEDMKKGQKLGGKKIYQHRQQSWANFSA